MTEIKLTKRYPLSRTEDITDAYMRGWNDALDAIQNAKFHIPLESNMFTDKDGDVWEWRDGSWHCISVAEQTERSE